MRKIDFEQMVYEAAGHEDVRAPGVWKKVLFRKADLQVGRVQMVNWAKLPAGNSFAAHYHEDMQEIFVLVSGQVRLRVGDAECTLQRGDSVLIDPREPHQMWNEGSEDAEYLAIGIVSGEDGRTVLLD